MCVLNYNFVGLLKTDYMMPKIKIMMSLNNFKTCSIRVLLVDMKNIALAYPLKANFRPK